MKHNELVEIIENQTGEKPKQRELAEALNVGVAVIGKRAERNLLSTKCRTAFARSMQ